MGYSSSVTSNTRLFVIPMVSATSSGVQGTQSSLEYSIVILFILRAYMCTPVGIHKLSYSSSEMSCSAHRAISLWNCSADGNDLAAPLFPRGCHVLVDSIVKFGLNFCTDCLYLSLSCDKCCL